MFGLKRSVLVFGFIVVCAGTLAWAEGDLESDLAPGQTFFPAEPAFHQPLHPLEIEAMDRAPGATDGTYFLFVSASGGGSATNSGLDYSYSGGGCLQADGNMAPDGEWDVDIQIPEGHTIGGIRYFYYDSVSENSMLKVYTFGGDGTVTLEFSISSSGDTGYGSDFDTLTVPANYADYSIALRFSMGITGSAHRACGARLVILD